MSRRNTIDGFPPDVRRMIQRKLYERGFQGYAELADELTTAGHPVSRSALHRFGTALEAQVRKAELDSLMARDEAAITGNTEASGGVQLDLLACLEGGAS